MILGNLHIFLLYRYMFLHLNKCPYIQYMNKGRLLRSRVDYPEQEFGPYERKKRTLETQSVSLSLTIRALGSFFFDLLSAVSLSLSADTSDWPAAASNSKSEVWLLNFFRQIYMHVYSLYHIGNMFNMSTTIIFLCVLFFQTCSCLVCIYMYLVLPHQDERSDVLPFNPF